MAFGRKDEDKKDAKKGFVRRNFGGPREFHDADSSKTPFKPPGDKPIYERETYNVPSIEVLIRDILKSNKNNKQKIDELNGLKIRVTALYDSKRITKAEASEMTDKINAAIEILQ